jgi:hypothetical protein
MEPSLLYISDQLLKALATKGRRRANSGQKDTENQVRASPFYFHGNSI